MVLTAPGLVAWVYRLFLEAIKLNFNFLTEVVILAYLLGSHASLTAPWQFIVVTLDFMSRLEGISLPTGVIIVILHKKNLRKICHKKIIFIVH